MEDKTMFKTMNEKELMKVNGGFYYVPVYDKNGKFLYLKQVPSI